MAYYHVTASGAGDNSGDSWANAMGLSDFETSIEGGGAQAVSAGDTYWVKEGTYTLTDTIDSNLQDGTATEPISIIGVVSGTTNEGSNVTQSDWATGANRPDFVGSDSYYFRVGNYYIVRNITNESGATNAFYTGQYNVVENCKFVNDYGATNARHALRCDAYTAVTNCEMSADNTIGIYATAGLKLKFCYIHDIPTASRAAIFLISNNITVTFCIFDNCAIGIDFNTTQTSDISNNTFYDCDVGISGTTGYGNTFKNNIFSDCSTDAIIFTTQTDINFFWNNHFYNNTDDFYGVDETNHYQDYEKTTGDPKFETAGSDFALQSDSPCLDAGMSIELGVGS